MIFLIYTSNVLFYKNNHYLAHLLELHYSSLNPLQTLVKIFYRKSLKHSAPGDFQRFSEFLFRIPRLFADYLFSCIILIQRITQKDGVSRYLLIVLFILIVDVFRETRFIFWKTRTFSYNASSGNFRKHWSYSLISTHYVIRTHSRIFQRKYDCIAEKDWFSGVMFI